ncbi:MAG TPA: TIGR03067 domain-containing protein [Gemmataceae bacterium]
MRTAALAAALALAGGLRAQDEAKELEKLKGTWVIVKAERGGKPADEPKGDRITFDADKITVNIRGTERKGKVKIDATKTPKQIDLIAEGEDAPGPAPAIYELEGDTLKMALGRPGGDRPAKFATEEGSMVIVLIFEREKNKEKK